MEALAVDYTTLSPLLLEVYQFACTLSVRLEGGEDLHVAEVRNRIDSLFARLDLEAEARDLVGAYESLKPHLVGILQDVVRHSSWDHITRCPYCRVEISDMSLAPGELLEEAEEISSRGAAGEPVVGDASVLLHLLAFAGREPYFVEAWARNQRSMYALSDPAINPADFLQTPPAPRLDAPWSYNEIDLKIPKEEPVNPIGRVGVAWRSMEAFCERHKLSPAGAPWYLLLGNRDSGKTALLRTPEADFAPIDEPYEGPSANVTWYYQSKGQMVLDVPGRMTADDVEDADRAQWLHLLDLLRTHRPKKPIDGIVLAVPLAQVLASENGAEELAGRLRSLLQVASRRLKMRPPIYVVFTKCDTVFGAFEFGMELTPAQRRGMLGVTPDGILGDAFSKDVFLTRYQELVAHLRNMSTYMLSLAETPRQAAGIYGWPIEMDAIGPRLGEFLETLTLSMGNTPLYLYRGSYFTAARPSGRPMVRALAFTPPSEPTPLPLPEQASGVSLFTGDLFGERVFPEKNAVLPALEVKGAALRRGRGSAGDRYTTPFPWRRLLQVLGVATLVVLLLLFFATWITLERAMVTEVAVGEHPMRFRLLPGGHFVMGSPSTDPLRYPDEDPFAASVSPFYAGVTEVTQQQWTAVMGQNPSFYRGPDFPVEQISWADAQAFVERLNAQHEASGKTPRGTVALLGETQWEYAARAGSTETLPEDLDAAAWYIANAKSEVDGIYTTHPVAHKTPNAFGLFDMAGNVGEWVADPYGEYRYGSFTGLLADPDPEHRILRGGAFFDQRRALRAANRMPRLPHYRDRGTGLRLTWIPAADTATGRLLAERGWTVNAYYAAKQWLADNRELVADLAGDMGDLVGAAWDKLMSDGPPAK